MFGYIDYVTLADFDVISRVEGLERSGVGPINNMLCRLQNEPNDE